MTAAIVRKKRGWQEGRQRATGGLPRLVSGGGITEGYTTVVVVLNLDAASSCRVIEVLFHHDWYQYLSMAPRDSVSRLCGFISHLFLALPHLLRLFLFHPCPSILHRLFLVDDGCHLRQSGPRGDGAIRWRLSSLAGFWPVSESREPRLQSNTNETTSGRDVKRQREPRISGLNQMLTRRSLEAASEGLEKGYPWRAVAITQNEPGRR